MEIISAVFDTTVQRTGIGRLSEVRRHEHALPHNIFHAELHRVHLKLLCQFIDRRFQRKDSLGSSVTTVSARCLHIRVNYIAGKPGCLASAGVKRNGLMPGQTDRRRSMLTVSSGIGQGVKINGTDMSVLHGPQTNGHFHLMAG